MATIKISSTEPKRKKARNFGEISSPATAQVATRPTILATHVVTGVPTDSQTRNPSGEPPDIKYALLLNDYQVDWHKRLMESFCPIPLRDIIHYEQDAQGDEDILNEYTPEYYGQPGSTRIFLVRFYPATYHRISGEEIYTPRTESRYNTN
jgi:hypothetical protein